MAHSKAEAKNAKFYISKEDWNKVIAYAESSYHQMKAEIGGQMVVVEDKDGDFILKDPVILKQEVSAGNCEMEAEALALHYAEMVKKYGDKVRHCWWHSHHTMGAFWSGTDNSTIMDNETQDFSVSLVVNLKQEYKLRVQFFYPFEHEENVHLNFMEDEDAERNEELDTEVAQLCTKSVTPITKYNGKPTTNTGQQANLWSSKDQQEVNEYNYGYGYGYGYNSFRDVDADIDTSLVPDDKIKPIHDLIEECQDKIADGNCTYEEFLQIRKHINESIEKYNLKIKLFTQNELNSKVYHLWPEDFLENINGGQDLAN